MNGASSVTCAGIPCLPLGVCPGGGADDRVGHAHGNDERGRARRAPPVPVDVQLALDVQLRDLDDDRELLSRFQGEPRGLVLEVGQL